VDVRWSEIQADRTAAGANTRSTSSGFGRRVIEVGEGSLRQEFWYRSHWIAAEADLVDTDLFGADLLLTDLFGPNRTYERNASVTLT